MLEFIKANPIKCCVFAWIAVISVITVIICVYDKVISKANRPGLRIPEKVLFTVFPLLGGGLAMFLTMQLIRHKTKHWQTYVLVPFFTLLWGAGIYAMFRFGIH